MPSDKARVLILTRIPWSDFAIVAVPTVFPSASLMTATALPRTLAAAVPAQDRRANPNIRLFMGLTSLEWSHGNG